MEAFFTSSFIFLLATVVAVLLSKRLGLGSVLGYLLAGVVLGPLAGMVTESDFLLDIGEIGVVMMLFLIGLELEPSRLWQMRFYLLGLGGVQVVLSSVCLAVVATFFVDTWQQASSIGLILALSSTAIVLQTLNEKKLENTQAGQAMFSVLLFQDVAIIPILAILSLIALGGSVNLSGFELTQVSELISQWTQTLLVVSLVICLLVVGYFVHKPILHYIAQTKLREIFTASALLVVVGSALLMKLVGLSPALGTFVAGVLLARSDYVHEIRTSIEPFKWLFLGLFFIGVGMGLDIALLAEKPGQILVNTLLLLLIKFMVLIVIASAFSMPWANRWLFALGLAQAGEFGFVLLAFSLEQSLLPESLVDEMVLVVTLSMLFTPVLFIIHSRLEKHLDKNNQGDKHQMQLPHNKPDVLIAGIGRFGQVVNRLLTSSGYITTVIDHDANLIENIRKFGGKAYYGDATHPDMLDGIGLDNIQIFVIAIDDRERTMHLVESVKRQFPHVKVVVRAFDRLHLYSLRKAGADIVIRETFASAVHSAVSTLVELGVPHLNAQKIGKAFCQHEEQTLDTLYELWDENHELTANQAYLAGIRSRDEEMRNILSSDQQQLEKKNNPS